MRRAPPIRHGLTCPSCRRSYPTIAGIPDLRHGSDGYLSLDAERDKARHLARHAAADVHALAREYYRITADVDPSRRARFLRHIASAEDRGEALLRRLAPAGRILEVGCGTGGFLAAAARRGEDVVGVDIALRWLVVARRRLEDQGLDVPLVAADAARLPWPDGSFDVVVADSLLEHLDNPVAALTEWRRVVRPGGRLLVWSPNRFSLLADPHVGLWGVGWLPMRLANRYVRARRGIGWTVRPRSAAWASREAILAGWSVVGVEAAPAPTAATGFALGLYDRARHSAPARWFGPLWQLRARRDAA